jgi:hypothetical protein
VTEQFFDTKDPAESVELTFDSSPDLPTGITLSGTPAITFAAKLGADASASALANGSAALDLSNTKVIVPVKGGIDGVDYVVRCQIATTNPKLILVLSGTLHVSSVGP